MTYEVSGVSYQMCATGASMPSFLLIADTSRLTPQTAAWQRVRFRNAARRHGHVAGASSALPPRSMYTCTRQASSRNQVSGVRCQVSKRMEARALFTAAPRPLFLTPDTSHLTPAPPSPALCPHRSLFPSGSSILSVRGGTSVIDPTAKDALDRRPIEGSGGSWTAGMRFKGQTVSCELARSGQDTTIWGRAGGYTSPLALLLRPGPLACGRVALPVEPGTLGVFSGERCQVSGVRKRPRIWATLRRESSLTPDTSHLTPGLSHLKPRRGWSVAKASGSRRHACAAIPHPARRPSAAGFFQKTFRLRGKRRWA